MLDSPLDPWVRDTQLIRPALQVLEATTLTAGTVINAFVDRSTHCCKCVMGVDNARCRLWAREVCRASGRCLGRPLTPTIPLSILPPRLLLLWSLCRCERRHAETDTTSSTSAIGASVVKLATDLAATATWEALSTRWIFAA